MSDQFPFPPPAPPAPYYAARSGPPGTVWAAAIITYVVAGLSILMTFALLVFAAFVGSMIGPTFSRDDQVSLSLIILLGAVISFAGSIAACYLAWKVTQRVGWARIALTVWTTVVGLLGALSVSPPGFLWTAGAIATVVLLFVPESNRWFDGENA